MSKVRFPNGMRAKDWSVFALSDKAGVVTDVFYARSNRLLIGKEMLHHRLTDNSWTLTTDLNTEFETIYKQQSHGGF